MARPSTREPLRASLLDRLTDERPEERSEAPGASGVSISMLRETVLRDVGWLLNTTRLSESPLLEENEFAAHSVLNYGIPDLVGMTGSSVDVAELERELKQSLIDFEPRILPQTLRVRVSRPKDELSFNALSFSIEGQLWAEPSPVAISLRSEIDLETGSVNVSENSGKAGR